MANYYEYSIKLVSNPDHVGVGLGDAPDGKEVICVGLEGAPINPELPENAKATGWIALTPECAKELLRILKTLVK